MHAATGPRERGVSGAGARFSRLYRSPVTRSAQSADAKGAEAASRMRTGPAGSLSRGSAAAAQLRIALHSRLAPSSFCARDFRRTFWQNSHLSNLSRAVSDQRSPMIVPAKDKRRSRRQFDPGTAAPGASKCHGPASVGGATSSSLKIRTNRRRRPAALPR